MIRLAPGANPKNALQMVTDAATKLANVLGSTALDQYNKYLGWASEQANLLSPQLHPDELDRLVTTRRYWSLLQLDTTTVQSSTLAELVRGEVQQRTIAFDAAKQRINADLKRWDHGEAVAVVVDTNVWLKHYEDPIGTVNWGEVVHELPHVPLVLTVPMMIVDELDRQKRNRANAPKGEISLRHRAGVALKYLESHAAKPGERRLLQEGNVASQPPTSTIHLAVLEQPLDQPPIHDADLEIIDRARSIMSYAARVKIVTSDYGMVYRARQAGLTAIRVKDYEEEQNEKSGDG